METTAPKKTRKKAQYILQRKATSDVGVWNTEELVSPFDTPEDAKTYVKEHELEGNFRIIRVVAELTAAKETRTKLT